MAENKIMTREELKKAYPDKIWAIEDIYKTDDLWEKDLEKLRNFSFILNKYKGKLSDSEKLLEYMNLQNDLVVLVNNLTNYSDRKSDEDTANAKYQQMCGRVMSVITELSCSITFETPEIISIPDYYYSELFKKNPKLEAFRRYLDKVRKKREHILSPEYEKILALSSEVTSQPENIYNMFSNADLKFEDAIDSDNNKHTLTSGTFISLVQSSDRTLRKSAFENLYKKYQEFSNTTAAILNAQIKSLDFHSKARKYSSSLEASLSVNEVPVSVYTNLINAVHDNLNYMYDYVKLRKKALNLDELHMYDLYVPIVSDMDDEIAYEDAVETVLKALEPLGEDYLSVLKSGFKNRWIDVYENENKCSGAYSAGAYCHPFVLLNYDKTIESMFTIAHEMGHAMHSYYSNKTQQPVDSEYVIFVAEVASTCNEVLLMNYLLKNTKDKKRKAYLINYFLEQFRTTLYRQTMFAEFEMNINEYVSSGNTLTADYLSKMYLELNKLYFGNDIVLDEQIAMEWARIPHFYYNFYVFQYATGYSAAIALAENILDDNPTHTDNYLKFLTEGCLYDPITLLRHAGVDMNSKEPVEKALAFFGKLIEEFSDLI
jgi:oligoendopeptidase F